MKILFLAVAVITTLASASGAGLPAEFHGRWSFDEERTSKVWPTRAKSEEERVRLEKLVAGFKMMREKFGKSVAGVFVISERTIVAQDAILNPRFDVLSVSAEQTGVSVKARHFQVPDDDNPKIVTLRLSEKDDQLVFELWDDDALQMLYVFTKQSAQSGSWR